jgi:hypothetical protein
MFEKLKLVARAIPVWKSRGDAKVFPALLPEVDHTKRIV